MTEKVPKSDLEELVKRWRERANAGKPRAGPETMLVCAEELTEVINE